MKKRTAKKKIHKKKNKTILAVEQSNNKSMTGSQQPKQNVDAVELKDLEFLADKSHQLLDKQITSYRQKHSNSGIIITVLTLFIPFFLSGLDNSYTIVKLIALLPIILIVWAIILLIQVLRSKPLDQGFHVDKFDELINKSYEDILLYEIGANKGSFTDNQKISELSNNKYNYAISLTVVSIILSSSLLLTNEFFKPEEKPTEIKIINPINMSNEKDNQNSGNSGNNEKKREIPVVPPKDRTQLSEGVNNPNPKTQQSDKGEKK